ncbi:enoyl-CoA hydratase [Bordetella genomosp. 8]|uniref:Enoyl-CoA hydratase n=2 Tax=Bordetella genomosp. 8 TaxID=1416806 RepID=A0A1W6YUI9_9BORD|nr:enoyl-CoA hydratase [Bordetella genomosp. 8]
MAATVTQSTTKTAEVLVTKIDDIGILTLNRPARMNAITTSLRNELIARLEAFNADDSVGAIVIKGAESNAFSSGQDLEEAAQIDWKTIISWQQAQKRMYDAVRELDKPCVIQVDGVCAGAGFHIALLADWRVATPESRWGQPEVKVGLASITGPHFMSLHIGNTHNVQLSVMADLISGQRAYEMGLISELTSPELLAETAMRQARKLATLPRTAVRLTKQRLRAVSQQAYDDACVAGIRAQLECFEAGEPQKLMSEFLKRRKNHA